MPVTTAVGAVLVSDGSAGGRRLHQVLATVGDLAVSRVLPYGPELPATLSGCAGKLVLAYAPGEAEEGLWLLDAVRDGPGEQGGVARIVLVGGVGEPGIAAEALRRGASGYLANGLPAEQLRSALAMLATLVAPPACSRVVVLSPPASGPRMRATGLLSAREREVIELIAGACTNAQIARRLGIAEGTVKRHVNSIFIKLDAVSRLDAVNKYHGRGIARPIRPGNAATLCAGAEIA
jgi:DNA-binding NarL/FixJ family response regulator